MAFFGEAIGRGAKTVAKRSSFVSTLDVATQNQKVLSVKESKLLLISKDVLMFAIILFDYGDSNSKISDQLLQNLLAGASVNIAKREALGDGRAGGPFSILPADHPRSGYPSGCFLVNLARRPRMRPA
ncbi:hypothetical protein TYRP_005143 [Tyrophagus putrescentiae]|nr:hypothetical protein TYRP_005143 [Tyrophagus putrescentiae]